MMAANALYERFRDHSVHEKRFQDALMCDFLAHARTHALQNMNKRGAWAAPLIGCMLLLTNTDAQDLRLSSYMVFSSLFEVLKVHPELSS